MTKDLDWLWAELRYHQGLNRLSATNLRLGMARARCIARRIRAYDPRRNRRARKRLSPR